MIAKFETVLEFGSTRPKAVGLILDFDAPNETQANNRHIAVRDAIERLQSKGIRWNLSEGFSVLSDTGFIAEPIDTDTPRIGVWFMPNNHTEACWKRFCNT